MIPSTVSDIGVDHLRKVPGYTDEQFDFLQEYVDQ